MNVEQRQVDSLIPYVNNAKQHQPEQIDLLAASIKEFGFNNPILVDGENGIIAGHGRLEAARKLGMEEVPTIELSHLSEAQKKAYILADNRLSEVHTSWDFEMVEIEIEHLQESGINFELTGFDSDFFSSAEPTSDLLEENPGDTYKEAHSVIVKCQDSIEQEVVYDKLTRLGMDCRVVSN